MLILTTFHLDSYVLDALEAGARGYLLKDTAPRELTRAIHTVAAGESVFSAQITERLVQRLVKENADGRGENAQRSLADLTERERVVAEADRGRSLERRNRRSAFHGRGNREDARLRILTKTASENRVQIALLVYQARS